jgi:hypothetical protein
VEDLDRVLAALYSLLDDSDRLGLSRTARLRIVAIIGDVEAIVRNRAISPGGRPEAASE